MKQNMLGHYSCSSREGDRPGHNLKKIAGRLKSRIEHLKYESLKYQESKIKWLVLFEKDNIYTTHETLTKSPEHCGCTPYYIKSFLFQHYKTFRCIVLSYLSVIVTTYFIPYTKNHIIYAFSTCQLQSVLQVVLSNHSCKLVYNLFPIHKVAAAALVHVYRYPSCDRCDLSANQIQALR